MSDQGFEEKDLGAQDSTVSAGDKPADTRIAPGVTEQDHTESEAGDAPVAQPKKRQLTSRTIGAIAACAIALVAVLAGVGYTAGLFGSAQTSEQATQQQTQEQSASASSTSAKQSSGQSENSQDGGDKASSAEDGKAKDENSSTDSSQEQSEGSSSEQASQSDASSGGLELGHPGRRHLTHLMAPALPPQLPRLHTRSPNLNPLLRRHPARFPFTSASIARVRKAMAWEASPMAPRSCSLKAPRCTMPCARPELLFPTRPIM